MPKHASKLFAGKFTPGDVEKTDKMLRRLQDLLPEFDKAESCGLECGGFRVIADTLRNRLEAFREKFLMQPTRG